MTTATHTPTPWRVGGHCQPFQIVHSVRIANGTFVNDSVAYVPETREEYEANAAHIVRCVNAHDRLVAALRIAMSVIKAHHAESDVRLKDARALLAEIEKGQA